MPLPVRTTLDDVKAITKYLATKPTGTTVSDAKKVLAANTLDARKLSAYKAWGFVEHEGDRLRLTPRGRHFTKTPAEGRTDLLDVLAEISPYRDVLERAYHQQVERYDTTEVAAFWHEEFGDEVGQTDKTLSEQAVCFFRIVEGASLGTLYMGRRGQATRVEFTVDALADFVTRSGNDGSEEPSAEDDAPPAEEAEPSGLDDSPAASPPTGADVQLFIAHGRRQKPLEQLKKILDGLGIKYVVAVDEPNVGRPISQKVEQLMRSSTGAIFIFTGDDQFTDSAGKSVMRPRENVIYELGAASLLYGRQIVIFKEEGVVFPTDFSDLGHISFEADNLEARTMDLMKELLELGAVKLVRG